MKTYKQVTHTTTFDSLHRVTCDLCGTSYPDERWGAERSYVVRETSVRLKEGTIDHDNNGGSHVETVVDICPGCFKDKLVPWLRSQGATVEPKEVVW